MSRSTRILSMYVGVHDSCITIASEDEVLLHLEAERVFRQKHIRCTPAEISRLVKAGLEFLGLGIDDVGEMVMTNDDRRTGKIDAFLTAPGKDEARILDRLFKPQFADHHASHIAAAGAAGFSEALVICADGGSREGSTRIYHQRGRNIQDVANAGDEIITGKFYGTITQLIIDPDLMKAHVSYPGKTMGLAGWGEYSRKFSDLLDRYRRELNQLHFESIEPLRRGFGLSDDYSRPWLDRDRRDLACTAQRFWEDAFIRIVERYAHQSRNLSLVGGCALNVLLTSRIMETGLFENIYIPPLCSDCGQSLGALLCFFPGLRVSYPFLGRGYGECEQTPPQLVDDLLEHRIVAWYQGRSEVGPRALGHRSFLGLPDSIEMRRRMSEGIKRREPYRPVAPTVLQDDAAAYFDLEGTSEFMTFAPAAKDITRELAPAIVHRDGTARVQTLSGRLNTVLAGVLEELKRRGLPPILMNTSFNLRGEPIVDTPEDALMTFRASGADVLYLNGERHAR